MSVDMAPQTMEDDQTNHFPLTELPYEIRQSVYVEYFRANPYVINQCQSESSRPKHAGQPFKPHASIRLLLVNKQLRFESEPLLFEHTVFHFCQKDNNSAIPCFYKIDNYSYCEACEPIYKKIKHLIIYLNYCNRIFQAGAGIMEPPEPKPEWMISLRNLHVVKAHAWLLPAESDFLPSGPILEWLRHIKDLDITVEIPFGDVTGTEGSRKWCHMLRVFIDKDRTVKILEQSKSCSHEDAVYNIRSRLRLKINDRIVANGVKSEELTATSGCVYTPPHQVLQWCAPPYISQRTQPRPRNYN